MGRYLFQLLLLLLFFPIRQYIGKPSNTIVPKFKRTHILTNGIFFTVGHINSVTSNSPTISCTIWGHTVHITFTMNFSQQKLISFLSQMKKIIYTFTQSRRPHFVIQKVKWGGSDVQKLELMWIPISGTIFIWLKIKKKLLRICVKISWI